MRRLLFFLLGCFLPFIFYTFSYSECVSPGTLEDVSSAFSAMVLGPNSTAEVEMYSSKDEAYSAVLGYPTEGQMAAGISGPLALTKNGCPFEAYYKNYIIPYVGYLCKLAVYSFDPNCQSCDDPEDLESKYYIDSECVCGSGDHIYLAYGKCKEGDGVQVPDGGITVVGNSKIYGAIGIGENIPGLNASCSYPEPNCNLTWDDLQSMISAVGAGSDCGTFYDDDDHDGVYNEDDDCPGTPDGDVVDQFGCSLPDSDGDGVPDDDDLCPDTLLGSSVDSYGCVIDPDIDPDIDSDGDGVPDVEDLCPNTPSGSTVGTDGCVNSPDPHDGDNDDDNDLLSDIVDWLRNISSISKTVSGDVKSIEKIEASNLDANRQQVLKTQDLIDGQEMTNKELKKITDLIDSDRVKSAETSMDNLNVNEYNSDNFSTVFEEGQDYVTPGDLSDESWLSDFVSHNPLKTALDNSGFDITGSCTMSLNLGSTLGSHDINICSLQPGFDVAGGIFYGLSILMSLLMIARGF